PVAGVAEWQTRMAQTHLSHKDVRVRIPPSAQSDRGERHTVAGPTNRRPAGRPWLCPVATFRAGGAAMRGFLSAAIATTVSIAGLGVAAAVTGAVLPEECSAENGKVTCSYTDATAMFTFTVPDGVTSVDLTLNGGAGGDAAAASALV